MEGSFGGNAINSNLVTEKNSIVIVLANLKLILQVHNDEFEGCFVWIYNNVVYKFWVNLTSTAIL